MHELCSPVLFSLLFRANRKRPAWPIGATLLALHAVVRVAGGRELFLPGAVEGHGRCNELHMIATSAQLVLLCRLDTLPLYRT